MYLNKKELLIHIFLKQVIPLFSSRGHKKTKNNNNRNKKKNLAHAHLMTFVSQSHWRQSGSGGVYAEWKHACVYRAVIWINSI